MTAEPRPEMLDNKSQLNLILIPLNLNLTPTLTLTLTLVHKMWKRIENEVKNPKFHVAKTCHYAQAIEGHAHCR